MASGLHDPCAWISARLEAALGPARLRIDNHSAQHRGHAGAAAGGHFQLTIVSTAFTGKSRLDRHRMVYAALADKLECGIHALAIIALTPEEATKKQV